MASIQKQVLEHLIKHGRTDYASITKATGLSNRQVKSCMLRLRQAGFGIRTYNYELPGGGKKFDVELTSAPDVQLREYNKCPNQPRWNR